MKEYGEVLDLVDGQDQVIGTILRGEMHKASYHSPKGFVRFTQAFIVNGKNEVWVPTRGLHKLIAPGGHDFSIAEHVLSGESYADAIIRGFDEEQHMTIELDQLKFLGVLPPTDEKPIFDGLFAYYDYDGPDPDFSREEFSSCQWVDIYALEKMFLAQSPLKASLLPALHLLIADMQQKS